MDNAANPRPYTRYASLAGKGVFISGGSSGIGAELTSATTFDVPISRPTTRFFVSFAMISCQPFTFTVAARSISGRRSAKPFG